MSLTIFHGNGISTNAECVHRMIFELAKKDKQKNFLYLVPEQARLQVEQELVAAHPEHVIGNIEVVSFTGLALSVLEELEIPLTNLLDDVGKSMILRRIGEEMKQELPVFGRNLSRRGFAEELKSAVNELAMSGVRSEGVKEALKGLGTHAPLQQKLSDIYKVYEEFSRQLGQKYTTSEELLFMLAKYAGQSQRIRRSRIILYGFNSFKQYQYQALEQCLMVCCGMILIATLGENPAGGPFPMAQNTCNVLAGIARAHNIPVRMGMPKGIREYAAAPEIRHLERHLFRSPTAVYEEEPHGLLFVTAQDPVREMDYVLREIMRLVREEGCRYSEIAVIAGDLSIYGGLAAAVFDKAGVPYFLDEKRRLEGNPLAELIEGLLDVLEENMSYDSIVGLIRNPFFPMEKEDADILDNYLVASGISGRKRWNESWTWLYGGMSAQRLNQINALRASVCERLSPLQEIWKNKKHSVKVREGIEALVHVLIEIGAESRMEAWAGRFEAEGDFIRQSEYRQAYKKVMDLFDQIVQLMGEDELRPQLLIDTLHSGFEGLEVGFIPMTFDRVVVGDLARTRIGRVRVLFLLGANDKVLPKETEQGGILNDYDREVLKEAGMPLLPTAREEAFFQQEYLYLAVTKPTERLIVTCSERSRAGKEIRRSYLIAQLQRMFPKLTAKRAGDLCGGPDGMLGKDDGFFLMIQGMRDYLDGREDTWWRELYRYYSREEDCRERLSRVKDGLFYAYRMEPLDEKIAKKLFEPEKENSITRLEQYAGCAYAHFLTYGLGLHPRKKHELKAADYGTVFHQAISGFFACLKENHRDWRTLEAGERLRMVEESVQKAMDRYASPVFESSARNRYAQKRIERMTDRTVWALGEQWKEGSYETILQEYVFSQEYGNAIRLPLKDGLTLSLQGRIDRIDIGEKDDCLYVKVIDYKTGQTQFDLGRVYHGLQLQLLLYLDAVMEMEKRRFPEKTVVPAGIYYYNLKDPLVDAMNLPQNEQDELRLKELRMNGLTNLDENAVNMIDPKGAHVVKGLDKKKDGSLKASAPAASGAQFALLQRFVKRKAQKLAEAMFDGNIGADPYEYQNRSSCEFCEYQSVCGFELRTEGCVCRRLEKLTKEEIWKAMEEEEK